MNLLSAQRRSGHPKEFDQDCIIQQLSRSTLHLCSYSAPSVRICKYKVHILWGSEASSDLALRSWQILLPRDIIQNVWKVLTVSYPVPTGQKECFYTWFLCLVYWISHYFSLLMLTARFCDLSNNRKRYNSTLSVQPFQSCPSFREVLNVREH